VDGALERVSVLCVGDAGATVRAATRVPTVRTTSTTARRTSARTAPRVRTASTATAASARAATPAGSARSRPSPAPSSTTSAASARITTARTADCASSRRDRPNISANVRQVGSVLSELLHTFDFIIIIIKRKYLGGVMSKDCKDTVQTLKTVTIRDCDAKERIEQLSDAVVDIAVENRKASDKQFRL